MCFPSVPLHAHSWTSDSVVTNEEKIEMFWSSWDFFDHSYLDSHLSLFPYSKVGTHSLLQVIIQIIISNLRNKLLKILKY